MLEKIELFDKDQDRLIKSFGNDELHLAVYYAKENNHIIGCIFQQMDGDDEDSTLMFVSVDEVILTFEEGECPADLTFF